MLRPLLPSQCLTDREIQLTDLHAVYKVFIFTLQAGDPGQGGEMLLNFHYNF